MFGAQWWGDQWYGTAWWDSPNIPTPAAPWFGPNWWGETYYGNTWWGQFSTSANIATAAQSSSFGVSPATTAFVVSANEYLGRFRRGDSVEFSSQLGVIPDVAPMLTVYNSGGSAVWSTSVPVISDTTFGIEFLVGSVMEPGSYTASMTYLVNGLVQAVPTSFDVVPGGDSGGSIIAIWDYNRPEGSYMLAQLESGQLVQGRRPHF